MEKRTRIVAVGDIHVKNTDKGKFKDFFRAASREGDVLVLAGDLTDTGHVTEAEILAEELKACNIPVVAVLGNHDYESNEQEEIKKILCNDRMTILDGESVVIGDVGFAGVKGFGGGFDKYMLPMWGEQVNKTFVQESVNEALKLERALVRLDSHGSNIKRFVILHYAPIKATIEGEPEAIYPFMGSSRLAEPINRRPVEAVFHGHAHVGKLEGTTTNGIKVFNISMPLMLKLGFEHGFFIYEV